MDNFEEIRKYKMLLDQGVINQDEFTLLKQKLLGLSPNDKVADEDEKKETKCTGELLTT